MVGGLFPSQETALRTDQIPGASLGGMKCDAFVAQRSLVCVTHKAYIHNSRLFRLRQKPNIKRTKLHILRLLNSTSKNEIEGFADLNKGLTQMFYDVIWTANVNEQKKLKTIKFHQHHHYFSCAMPGNELDLDVLYYKWGSKQ